MFSPSQEQEDIIQLISCGIDVVCDAVAGAGKTTTILFLAEANPDKKILQITYNKQLKQEVREKAKDCDNLEVHTYHSLAYKYYDEIGKDDAGIKKIISDDMPLLSDPNIDILVIDEAQDMTLTLFRLVRKFLKDISDFDSVGDLCDLGDLHFTLDDQTIFDVDIADNVNVQSTKQIIEQPKKITMLVLGDRRQSIYEFKDSDSRFLTLAGTIWQRPMIRKLLQRSYRLTNQVAWFVNDIMLGKPYIVADKEGPHINYICDNSIEHAAQTLCSEIITMVKKEIIKASDIFILSGSVKSNYAPYKQLEHAFVANGILCYVSNSDYAGLDSKVIDGKAVFTTFHQAKGRERALVIVFGFDSSFFDYFAKDKPREMCPAELYVAATRTTRYLYLVEHKSYKTHSLSFLNYNEILSSKYVNFINSGRMKEKEKSKVGAGHVAVKVKEKHVVKPVELVKYLKEDTIAFCTHAVDCLFKTINPASNKVQIPSMVKGKKDTREDVSDINGIVIPAIWEAKKSGRTTLHKCIHAANLDNFLKEYYSGLKDPCQTIPEYLYLGNLYLSVVNELHHKMIQIENYNWLTAEMVECCLENLDKHVIAKHIHFEHFIGDKNLSKENILVEAFNKKRLRGAFGQFYFFGRLDAVDDTTVWEFKCVNDLTLEHRLQLVLYAWMWKMYNLNNTGNVNNLNNTSNVDEKNNNTRLFKLMNIRTGEILQLNTESYLIDDIVCLLLMEKYGPTKNVSDEEFIRKCHA